MPNQRISELNEKLKLNCNYLGDIKFRDSVDTVSTDNNKLLLIAKEKTYNIKKSLFQILKNL